MAVNFGDTIMEGSVAPSVKVQAPVEDNSEATRAQGQAAMFESFGQAANQIGRIAGSIFQQNQQDAGRKVLVDYEQRLLDLADAADQGADKSWIMTQARQLRSEYLSNNPSLQEDFDKIWTNTVNSNGLGTVIKSGTLEQQAEEAKTAEAIKLGYPDRNSYDAFLAQARQVQAINQQYDLILKNNGVITESMKYQGLQAVVGLADKAFPVAQTQINKATAEIEANPANKAQIVQDLNMTIGQNIQLLKASGGSADIDFITTPIEGLLDTFNKWADGSVEMGILKNDIEITQLKYDAMFAANGDLSKFIAQSRLLKSAGLENTKLMTDLLTANPQVIELLRDATDPTKSLNILGDSDNNERFTQRVVDIASTSMDDPVAIEEFKQTLAGIVDGAYTNERNAKDGSLGFKGTVEVLGSASVGEFIRNNGPLPAAHADKFVEVLKNNYEAELLPVIQQSWQSQRIQIPAGFGEGPRSMEVVPMDVLTPVWNGNAVEFIAKPEYADNEGIQSLVNDINSGSGSIGQPLNALINAYANVSGTDPKTIWEQQFANQLFNLDGNEMSDRVNRVLDQTAQQPVAPLASIEQGITTLEQINVNPQELTLEDFNPDPQVAYQQITRTVEQTSAANPAGVVNATSPISFAQNFIGMAEGNEKDRQVLSSFIKQTAGISINPAQTAWCAAFVDAILHATGSKGTGALNARSYLNWGKPVSQPQVGDVVVFSRGDPNGWQGHVGFYAGTNLDGTIKVLGGNQSNSVSFSDYDASKVLGYRRAN